MTIDLRAVGQALREWFTPPPPPKPEHRQVLVRNEWIGPRGTAEEIAILSPTGIRVITPEDRS